MAPRSEIKHVQDVWLDGYRRLLAEALAGGQVRVLAENSEQRMHPRFELNTTDVTARDDAVLAIEDMSRTGLRFISDISYVQDGILSISLAKVFSADVRVVACEAVSDQAGSGSRHRVRCSFADDGQGLLFLTLALELLRIERE